MTELRIFSYLPNPRVWKAGHCRTHWRRRVGGTEPCGRQTRGLAQRLRRPPVKRCPPKDAQPRSASGDGQIGIFEPTASCAQAPARRKDVSLADICFACELALFRDGLGGGETPTALSMPRS